MKKMLSIVLCLCILLSLCSCTSKQNNEPDIDEKTGKNIITIANVFPTNSYDGFVDYIEKFNKSNNEYIAVIQDFTGVDHDEWDMAGCDESVLENAANKLSAEISSGIVPDVIIVQPKIPVYSYVQKGVLADIYELMENDPDFHKEDYIENIFKASEIDGKLYEVFPHFALEGLFAKTSETGESSSWSAAEFYCDLTCRI